MSSRLLALALLSLIPFGDAKKKPGPVHDPLKDARLNATLWFAASGEADACYRQGYAAAEARLAALGHSDGKDVVVTDLDETVISNAAWTARRILDGKDYPHLWNEWEREGKATAFGGAVEFFKLADHLGYRICYLSNRNTENTAATLANLQKLGLPQADTAHIMFLPPNTSSSKEARRQKLRRQGYRIVMLMGDNLADFIDLASKSTEQARADSVAAHRNDWGRRFIVFPNPLYGNWLSAIEGGGKREQKDSSIVERVEKIGL